MTLEGDVNTTVPHEPGVRPVTPPTAERTRRRRRPSGAPPPLPKHIGTTGTGWIVAVVVLSGWLILGYIFDRVIRFTNRVDAALLRQIVRLRTEWLTDVTRAIDAAVSYWTVIVLFVVLGFVLMALRRWRHFFTFLACMALLQLVGEPMWEAVARPRPFDVTIIGEWAGFSLPPPVLAFLTLLVVAIAYTLVVPGRPRTIAKVAGAVVVAVYAATELYLATVHPFDVAVGVTMAVALGGHDITVLGFCRLRFYPQKHDLRTIMAQRLGCETDVLDEALFFENEMIRWEYRDHGIRAAQMQKGERKQESHTGIFVFRLGDYRARRSLCQLPPDFAPVQMVFADNGQ
jgi:hypothetical protein